MRRPPKYFCETVSCHSPGESAAVVAHAGGLFKS
jgi:hypothetical protein